MADLGIDCADSGILRFLKRWHIISGVSLGDRIKSWDVLQTVRLLQDRIAIDEAVLDLGAYASEILPSLRRLGYRNLSGIDLNPRICSMPYSGEIRYEVGDLYSTSFPDASFSAITAISVIEHGFDPERLLKEVSRLLRPGGYFIASIDYWPDKIDTAGISAFGLDWMIFSRKELKEFFENAGYYALEPCGDLDFQSEQATVKWLGRSYTFAWLMLRKFGDSL